MNDERIETAGIGRRTLEQPRVGNRPVDIGKAHGSRVALVYTPPPGKKPPRNITCHRCWLRNGSWPMRSGSIERILRR